VANHQRVLDLFGARGSVVVTALVGYYVMVCMAVNKHDHPVPAEAAVLMPALKGTNIEVEKWNCVAVLTPARC